MSNRSNVNNMVHFFQQALQNRVYTRAETVHIQKLSARFQQCIQEYRRQMETARRYHGLKPNRARIKGRGMYSRLPGFQTMAWKLEVDIRQSNVISEARKNAAIRSLRDISRTLYKELAPYSFQPRYDQPLSRQGALGKGACIALKGTEFAIGITQGVFGTVLRTALRQPHEAVQLAPLIQVLQSTLCDVKTEEQRVRLVRDYLHKLLLCSDEDFPICNINRNTLLRRAWKTLRGTCCRSFGDPRYSLLEDCCAWSRVPQTLKNSPEARRRVSRLWNKIIVALRSLGWAMFRTKHVYKNEMPDTKAYPMLYHTIAHQSFYKGIEYLDKNVGNEENKYYAIASLCMILLAVGHQENTLNDILLATENILLHSRNLISVNAIMGFIFLVNAFTACKEITPIIENILFGSIVVGVYTPVIKFISMLVKTGYRTVRGLSDEAHDSWRQFIRQFGNQHSALAR